MKKKKYFSMQWIYVSTPFATQSIEAVALACPCLGCQVKATLRSLMRSRMRRKIWGARATIIATLMQASSVYNRLYRATGDPGVTAQS